MKAADTLTINMAKLAALMNGELFGVHKIFHAPKLFGIPEVEFDSKSEMVIVSELIPGDSQVVGE